MANAETLYQPNVAFPQELERGRTQTVKLSVYRGGALQSPTQSGSSYTLFDPNDNMLVSAQEVTVTGNVATYSVTSSVLASTLTLGEGYREEWSLIMPDGETHLFERPAALIRKRLYPVVSDVNLEARYPEITDHKHAYGGSWDGFIDEAWTDIKLRLLQEGVLPYLVRSPSSMRSIHLHLSLALVFRGLHSGLEGQTKWLDLATLHMAEYEREWGKANFLVDADNDGQADDSNARRALSSPVLPNASPHTRYFGRFGLK